MASWRMAWSGRLGERAGSISYIRVAPCSSATSRRFALLVCSFLNSLLYTAAITKLPDVMPYYCRRT